MSEYRNTKRPHFDLCAAGVCQSSEKSYVSFWFTLHHDVPPQVTMCPSRHASSNMYHPHGVVSRVAWTLTNGLVFFIYQLRNLFVFLEAMCQRFYSSFASEFGLRHKSDHEEKYFWKRFYFYPSQRKIPFSACYERTISVASNLS